MRNQRQNCVGFFIYKQVSAFVVRRDNYKNGCDLYVRLFHDMLVVFLKW